MRQEFNGITTDTGPDLWVPLRAYRTLFSSDSESLTLELAGRLKSGVSRVQAEAECRTIWQSAMNDYYRNVEHRSRKTPPSWSRAVSSSNPSSEVYPSCAAALTAC